MRITLKTITAVFFVFASCLLSAQDHKTVHSMVNVLQGTQGEGLASGYLFPGATYPHGMVQFTPSFFSKTSGFVINQASGAGCEHMGNCPTFPIADSLTESPRDIRSADISISDEGGHAGYYHAMVQGAIMAEMTVTPHTGMARYTFPENETRGTVIVGTGIAATHIDEASVVITGPSSFEGYSTGGSFCGAPTPYKVYFVAEFDALATESGTWKDECILPGSTSADGDMSGVYFTFNLNETRQVQYRIGISYVSVENARKNLMTENNEWDFDRVRKNAEVAWDHVLGLIEVEGATADKERQFYTHLYRSFIHPSVCSDVNGQYMGADFNVHHSAHVQYTQLSNWDTYRTQIQLLAMLEPDVASDIVRSHMDFAIQSGGAFPRWVMANIETGIMQGDPSATLVSNAWAFGARDYDCNLLFEIMKKGADVPGSKSQSVETRPQLKSYLEKGYCSPSLQLEYTSADFAIGKFAENALGNDEEAQRYYQRARSWKNIFNPATKWLQAKGRDGKWGNPQSGWREATYKDYFWMVPYDVHGLVEIIGGKEMALTRLDDYFTRLDAGYDDDWFACGNEPCFGAPWLYNWIGMPWKTSQVIRRILNDQYSSAVDGLPGNDDLGAMGAWYVWACMGLYPAIPGVGGFTLNTPLFPFMTVHLPSGDLVIKGGSETEAYTRSLRINGKKSRSSWIWLEDVQGGAKLKFRSSIKPGLRWATASEPPSFE